MWIQCILVSKYLVQRINSRPTLRGIGNIYDHFSLGQVLGKGRYGVVRLAECNVIVIMISPLGHVTAIRCKDHKQKEGESRPTQTRIDSSSQHQGTSPPSLPSSRAATTNTSFPFTKSMKTIT